MEEEEMSLGEGGGDVARRGKQLGQFQFERENDIVLFRY